ncbi:MAG: hypothetical protein ABSA83_21635 [Verrucomicrobiota bacterium]
MNTAKKGSRFENRVYRILDRMLNDHDLGIDPASARIYKGKSYFSKSGKNEYKTDISIEVFERGQDEPSAVWIYECKCWDSSVSRQMLLGFHSLLADIGGDRTIGKIVICGGIEEGAENFAKENGIGIISLRAGSWKVIVPAFVGIAFVETVKATEGVLGPSLCADLASGLNAIGKTDYLQRLKAIRVFLGVGILTSVAIYYNAKVASVNSTKTGGVPLSGTQASPGTVTMASSNKDLLLSNNSPALASPKNAGEKQGSVSASEHKWIVPISLIRAETEDPHSSCKFSNWSSSAPLPVAPPSLPWAVAAYYIANDSDPHSWYVDSPWIILDQAGAVYATNCPLTSPIGGIVIAGTFYAVSNRPAICQVILGDPVWYKSHPPECQDCPTHFSIKELTVMAADVIFLERTNVWDRKRRIEECLPLPQQVIGLPALYYVKALQFHFDQSTTDVPTGQANSW